MNDRLFRNQKALNVAQEKERERLDAALGRIQNLESQLAMLRTETTSLRQMVTQLLVARGSGPTVRETA